MEIDMRLKTPEKENMHVINIPWLDGLAYRLIREGLLLDELVEIGLYKKMVENSILIPRAFTSTPSEVEEWDYHLADLLTNAFPHMEDYILSPEYDISMEKIQDVMGNHIEDTIPNNASNLVSFKSWVGDSNMILTSFSDFEEFRNYASDTERNEREKLFSAGSKDKRNMRIPRSRKNRIRIRPTKREIPGLRRKITKL